MQHRKIVLAALVAAGLFLAPAPSLAESSQAEPGVVNVNTATADELTLLPGIGETKARAIVDHRQANGAYHDVDDLLEVKGIGEAALERIRGRVVLQGATTLRE